MRLSFGDSGDWDFLSLLERGDFSFEAFALGDLSLGNFSRCDFVLGDFSLDFSREVVDTFDLLRDGDCSIFLRLGETLSLFCLSDPSLRFGDLLREGCRVPSLTDESRVSLPRDLLSEGSRDLFRRRRLDDERLLDL